MQHATRRRLSLICSLLMLSVVAEAVTARSVVEELDDGPSPAARVEQIQHDARARFQAGLQEFTDRGRQRPFDVIDQLRRCEYIDQFISAYEYVSFMDELAEQSEQCHADVAQRYPGHPEVVLREVQRTFGEAQLRRGHELVNGVAGHTWTNGQLSQLYALLARTADVIGRRDLALDYALRALRADESADVRLIAASELLARKERGRALDILSASGSEPDDSWSLGRQMQLLADLDAREPVLKLHARLLDLGTYNHLEAARALRAVGAIDPARKELELAGTQGGYTADDEKERFLFELEQGSAAGAAAAYDAWRDLGWKSDPLGINRFALLLRSPATPWQARDLLALAGFAGALAAIAAFIGLPIGLVHYRGLAVRARTAAEYPRQGWQLRHAWLAMFAYGAASLMALYAAGPLDFAEGTRGRVWSVMAQPDQLARMAIFESFLLLAVLAPVAVRAKTRQRIWTNTKWSTGKCVAIGALIAIAFRLPLLIAWLTRPEMTVLLTADDAVWQVLSEVREVYGVAAALYLLALAAPVIEEILFRGVMLNAFAAHIRFGWANVLQAALFSAMHMNVKAAPLLFGIGLILGTLARRSGGLLAPMIMHALFNLIAGVILLAPAS